MMTRYGLTRDHAACGKFDSAHMGRVQWIRQNVYTDVLAGVQSKSFAGQNTFSAMLEKIMKIFSYGGAPPVDSPHSSTFEGTPVVHDGDNLANWLREGRCEYVQGGVECLTRRGLRVRRVGTGDQTLGEENRMSEYEGDVVVLARSSGTAFLPEDLFSGEYKVCQSVVYVVFRGPLIHLSCAAASQPLSRELLDRRLVCRLD